MCDGQASSLQKTLQSVVTRVPKIVVRRAEEIFPALKEIMKDVAGSQSEACPSSPHSGDQADDIKVEEFSDMGVGNDPAPMTCVEIKVEHEDSLDSQKEVPGSHSEVCPSFHSGDQAANIKVEEFSDMEDGEGPIPITFVEIKAEHEDCTHPQEDVPSSYIDTYPPSSHDELRTINIKVEEISDVELEEDPLPISFPGIGAENVSVMNEHRVLRRECAFSCDVCHKSFIRSSGLKRHQRIHAAGRSFSCEVCNKSFSRHGHLKEHQRIHSGERPFSCPVCYKSFSQQNHLRGHQRIHSGERPFSCQVCNRSFTKRSHLKEHLHIHSGERAFSCHICAKSFTTNNVLKVHQRIHSDERPFSCAVCNKSYVSKNQVKVHLRKHSGERPFSCDVCNKSYTCSSDLKVHQRIHSGERPFSCDMCTKSFIRNSHLKAHQRIHSGERPYPCDMCKRSFNQHSHLKVHQRICSG